MNNRNHWEIWNLGTPVSFKVLEVVGVGPRVVGVSNDTVNVYKAATMDEFEKDEMMESYGIFFSFPEESPDSDNDMKSIFSPEACEDILREVNRHTIPYRWYKMNNEKGDESSVKPMLTREGKTVLASAHPSGVTVYKYEGNWTEKGLYRLEIIHEITLIGNGQDQGIKFLSMVFFPESIEELACEHGYYANTCVPNELKLALNRFSMAANQLVRTWEKYNDTHMINRKYPFRKDFYEVALEILEWANTHTTRER